MMLYNVPFSCNLACYILSRIDYAGTLRTYSVHHISKVSVYSHLNLQRKPPLLSPTKLREELGWRKEVILSVEIQPVMAPYRVHWSPHSRDFICLMSHFHFPTKFTPRSTRIRNSVLIKVNTLYFAAYLPLPTVDNQDYPANGSAAALPCRPTANNHYLNERFSY